MLKVILTGANDAAMLAGLRERQLHATHADAATLERGGGQAADAIVFDSRHLPRLPREFAAIRRHYPNAGLVILARTVDSADLLEAMRMGANEWITEPIVFDELVAAIRRVARPANTAPIGKTFAILGAKGGVGSTTVAVNLATSMTLISKQPALLIDLHPAYGDAAVFLGVEPRFSVIDALENLHRLDETYLRGLIAATPAGVDLLASGERVSTAAFEAATIRSMLDVASAIYRHIVLDCPRTVPAVLDAIDGATQIVVVANQELPALRSAARLVASLRQRCGADRVKIAITRFDAKSDIGRADIEKALGGAIHYQFPNDYRASVGAITRGEPLIVSNHSQLASSISHCARQLGGFQAARPEAPKPGLFGRFGGHR